jgi:excisionase family DNA binding protein
MSTATRPLLTPREVAAMLGISKVTLYRYVKAGKIPAVRLSSHSFRFRPEDIDALIAEVTSG